MNKVKIIIKDNKIIPTVGKGPILDPIYVTEEQLSLFNAMKLNIEIVSQKLTKIPNISDAIEAKLTDIITEESTDEAVEETIIEEETAEVDQVVEEESVAEEFDIETATKKELKEILDKEKVSYRFNANLNELKELVEKEVLKKK